MNIERLNLDVQTRPQPGQGGRRVLRITCPRNRKRSIASETDPVQQRLDALLQHRCLATLMNLAARKGAKAGLADRVLAYLEAGDKADPEDARWKALQYPVPRRPGSTQGPGQAARGLDRGRRRRQRLAADPGLSRSRIGPDPRRHPPFRGGPRGRRARRRRIPHAGRLVHGGRIAAMPTIGPASRPSR